MFNTKSTFVAGVALSVCFTPNAIAEEQETIIVTANRVAESADETLASVSVITRQDIQQTQAQDVIELLRLQAGVDVSRNGGPGGNTSIFMRGTNANHSLVLIDGVRASSATTGSFAWQYLSLTDVEKIEIVRGPSATQYGSDAIGGVIQIFTRKNKQFHARAEVGSYNTRAVEAGIGGGKKIKYSVNLSAKNTDSFSSTNDKHAAYDPDDDGFKNKSVSANVAFPFSSKTELAVKGWYSDSEKHYDALAFPPPGFTPTPAPGLSESTNATLDIRLKNQTTSRWKQTFSVGVSKDDAIDTSPYANQIKTDRIMADWQHDVTLAANHLLTMGLSAVNDESSNFDRINDSITFDQSVNNHAGFIISQNQLGKHAFDVSARIDDYETFGNHTTGKLAWGYDVNKALRLLASYGTAFKAPTFNELYFPNYGNPNLKPESSRSSEIATHYQITKSQKLKLSAYHTEIEDLINSVEVSPFVYRAENVDSATIDGLELEHDYYRGRWGLFTRITLQKAINEKTREDLLRRPRRKLSMQLKHSLQNGGHAGAEWVYASKRLDFGGVELDSYSLINLSTRLKMEKNLWFEGRIENLLDSDYELAYGYNTPGLSIYFGINYTLAQ